MKNWLRKTLAAALILGVEAGLGSPDDAEAAKRKKKVAPKPVSKVEQEVVRQAWRAGQQMVEEGRLKGAVVYLRQYLALKPRSVDGWYWLGRAFAAQGDYERAQNAFGRAVAIDPEYPALTPDRRDLWLRPMVVHSPWKAPLLAGTRVPAQAPASGDAASGAPASLDLPPAPPGSQPAEGWVVVSAWMTDPRFTAVGDWRVTVDRMGLMDQPRVPVAWKGDKPSVVYAWGGDGWFTLRPEELESPQDVLGRSRSLLLARTKETGWVLGKESEQYLPVQVRSWRFQWLGTVLTPR